MRDRLGKKEYLVLIGLVTGALVFSLINFILAPQARAYTQAKYELACEKDSLSAARAAVASAPEERDRLNNIKEEFAVKTDPYAKNIRDGADIIFLGNITAAGNIMAIEIVPGNIIEKPHTLELPVRITLQGDYRSVVDFCKRIDKGSKGCTSEIRSLSIETASPSKTAKTTDPAANTGAIRAVVGIVMYSVKNPEGKLYLEGLAKTLTGRQDVFRPAAANTRPPGLSSYFSDPS
jgi:type IV pilus assembly protein PilO